MVSLGSQSLGRYPIPEQPGDGGMVTKHIQGMVRTWMIWIRRTKEQDV